MSEPVSPILPALAAALAHDLGASMHDIATAAGIGRTTLHRHFANRQALTQAVADYAMAECDRLFDEIGIDTLPVDEVLERLSAQVLPLALVYTLLWAEPAITTHTDMDAEVNLRDDRFEAFAVRGQAEGFFRPDVPARWIVFSIGSQAVAVWWAVRDEFVGAREAGRLFRTTTLDGLAGRPRSTDA